MKKRIFSVLALVLVLFFAAELVAADDLFDLNSTSSGSDTTADTEEVASTETKAVKEDVAPQTADLSVKDAMADKKGEKELRELQIIKDDKIKVVQKKDFSKDGRFELGVGVGAAFNDWNNIFTVGLNFGYHFNEYLGLHVRGLYGAAVIDKSFKENVEGVNGDAALISTSNLKYAGGLAFEFSPIYGKMSLFGNAIAKYDLSVLAGASYYVVETEHLEESETNGNISADLGVAGKLFLGSNFAVNCNLDWHMMSDDRFKIEGSGKENYVKTDFVFLLGASMFFPFN